MEMVIVLVIALLILGPKRLPAAGRLLGHGNREFKDSITGHERTPTTDVALARRAGHGRRGAQELSNARSDTPDYAVRPARDQLSHAELASWPPAARTELPALSADAEVLLLDVTGTFGTRVAR